MKIERHTQFEVNGEVFTASSARSLVHQMNEASFQPDPCDQKYMDAVRDRVTFQDGTKPRTDTFHHFVEDMVAGGHIHILGAIS